MMRLNTFNKRLRRRECGLCEECGNEPIICNNRIGEVCKYKALARTATGSVTRWKDLKLVFETNPVCPYTKKQLQIGVNATLDHIIPTCRGGSDENENLQFVYFCDDFDVNKIKGGMTDAEFRYAISVLYKGIFEVV